MGKLKFTLSNIFLWLGIVASCLLLENVPFMAIGTPKGLSDTHFFMFFALAMSCYIPYFLIEHIKNKAKFDFVLGPIMIIGFVCATLAIWLLGDVEITKATTINYSIDQWEATKQTLSTFIFMLSLYAVLFFFNKNYPSIRKLKVVFVILILVAHACCIYSLIAEIGEYSEILNNQTSNANIKSFFWNPNMFAGYLLMGILACIGLNYFKKNAFSYISILFLLTIVFFVGSLTGTSVSLLVVLIYFLVEILFYFKKSIKAAILLLALYLAILVGLVVLYASALNYDLGQLSNLCHSIYRSFDIVNYDSISGRTKIWNYSITFLSEDPIRLIFGVGFRNSPYITAALNFYSLGNTLSCHSGYIQILINFGIVGMVIYSLFVLYYFYCAFRLLKRDTRFSLLFLLAGFALLSYGVTESFFLFNPNTQGIILGVAFFLPVVNKWKHLKHHEIGDQAIEINKPEKMDPELITKSFGKILMSLIAVASSLFIFSFFRDNIFIKFLIINVIGILVICAFTVPFIISCIAIKIRLKVAVTICVLNFLFIGGAFAYLVVRYYQDNLSFVDNSKWVYPIMLAMVLAAECFILGTFKRRNFKDYAASLLGVTKNSFMGIIGVFAVAMATFGVFNYMDVISPLTFIIYPAIALLFFYLFSYIVPFKDQREWINGYNHIALYSLKKEVLLDRLGAFNEDRMD